VLKGRVSLIIHENMTTVFETTVHLGHYLDPYGGSSAKIELAHMLRFRYICGNFDWPICVHYNFLEMNGQGNVFLIYFGFSWVFPPEVVRIALTMFEYFVNCFPVAGKKILIKMLSHSKNWCFSYM